MTMQGFLPPISSTTSLRLLSAEKCRKRRPVSVEPVKETASMPGWRPIGSPTSGPVPVTTLRTPAGMPASSASSATRSAVSEVSSAGLTHQRAAGGERRADLPGEHQEREVPGQHQPDDADRLADDERDVVVGGRRHLVVDLVDRLGVPAQALHGLGQVDGLAVEDGLAAVEALHHRELDEVRLDQVRQPQQRRLALGRVQLRPAPSSKAARALATAASTSSAPQAGRRASTAPSAGLTVSKVRPERAATFSPPMKHCGRKRQARLRSSCSRHGLAGRSWSLPSDAVGGQMPAGTSMPSGAA